MSKGKPIEFWRSMRSLVERGLSLKRAAKQFGMSYSAVQARSALEGWKFHGRGRPKILDHPDGTERAQTAKREAERDAAEAMLEREAEVLVIDVKKAEISCQKVLATHSVRLKVAFSELVVQTVEDLRSGDVKPKDRALALGALKAVCDRLYGWDKEPDLHQLEVAQTAAINLELQATPPEKLKAMALARRGLLTAERDGQGGGPSPNRPERPDAGGDGLPDQREVPKELAQERHPDPLSGIDHDQHDDSALKYRKLKPEPHPILRPQVPGNSHSVGNPTTPSVQIGSPPLSPEERRKQQLEELARLRAEWRGQRR